MKTFRCGFQHVGSCQRQDNSSKKRTFGACVLNIVYKMSQWTGLLKQSCLSWCGGGFVSLLIGEPTSTRSSFRYRFG